MWDLYGRILALGPSNDRIANERRRDSDEAGRFDGTMRESSRSAAKEPDMSDPTQPSPTPDQPAHPPPIPLPDREPRPIQEPEPGTLPDEIPNPNPDENIEPPKHV